MVGWLSPRPAVKSHMQIGPFAFQREAIMVSLVGSASAFISSAVPSAQLASTSGRPQQTPRCLTTGSSFLAIGGSYAKPSTIVDGYVRIHPSTFIDQRSVGL